jgi:hypothetical protein
MRYPNFYVSSRVVFSTGNRRFAGVAESNPAAFDGPLCAAAIPPRRTTV